MKNKSNVINLGCRLNSYESRIIENILNKNKISNTTVINTCAVTNQAVQKSRLEIRKAKKKNPNNSIIVTGCASHIEPFFFKKMPEVERVIDNKVKTQEVYYKKNFNNLISEVDTRLQQFPKDVDAFSTKTRALLQIQQGCDHRCTFCIIPFGRGNSISLPLGEIVKRTEDIINYGYSEIVITGVDITSYGHDLPGKPPLGQILKRLLKIVPKITRLRLSSIDPAEIDEDLLDLIINEPKLMPHIHFSVQSGNNLILKRMKRRHTREDIINICKYIKIRRHEMTFGADFIVGFPTETEEFFMESIDCIEKCQFSNLHIFPFSPKKGTPASKMPQIKKILKTQRASLMKSVGYKIKENLIKKKISSVVKILFECEKLSYTNDYFKVRVEGIPRSKNKFLRGQLVDVKLENYSDDVIFGKIL